MCVSSLLRTSTLTPHIFPAHPIPAALKIPPIFHSSSSSVTLHLARFWALRRRESQCSASGALFKCWGPFSWFCFLEVQMFELKRACQPYSCKFGGVTVYDQRSQALKTKTSLVVSSHCVCGRKLVAKLLKHE